MAGQGLHPEPVSTSMAGADGTGKASSPWGYFQNHLHASHVAAESSLQLCKLASLFTDTSLPVQGKTQKEAFLEVLNLVTANHCSACVT